MGVFDTKSTKGDAKPYEQDATTRMIPGAETFNGAIQMAVTAAFAAVMTMY